MSQIEDLEGRTGSMVDVATNPVIPGARQQTLGADRVIPGAGLLPRHRTQLAGPSTNHQLCVNIH